MPITVRTITCLSILLLFSGSTYAQFSLEGFSLSDSTNEWFYSQLSYDKLNAIDGEFAVLERKARETHPFLLNGNWNKGSLIFKGKHYIDQQLIFDITTNQIFVGISPGLNTVITPIKINQEQITEFVLDNRLFRYLKTELLLYPNGFYEVIYEKGTYKMYVHRKKVLRISGNESNYTNVDSYLITSDDAEFNLYKNKRSFYKIFPEHKKKIKGYIKTNKLSGKKGRDTDLVKIMAYCNELYE